MYDFLLSATDETGTRTTHHIQARTATEAHSKLDSQGYRDITLRTDDAGAVFAQVLQDDENVSLSDQVEFRFMSSFGFFFFLLKKMASKSWLLLLCAFSLVVLKWFNSQRLGVIGMLAIAMLITPVLISAWGTIFGLRRKYDMFLHEYAWGRWNELISRAPTLRGYVPDYELDAREACALAGLGQLKEGLDKMRAYENCEDPPRWMYLCRLSELYWVAEMHEEALRCHKEAYEEDPENPTVELDYAMALLRNNKDTNLAKQLIESAETKPLSDLLTLILPFIKGLFFLNTGNEPRAIEAFGKVNANLVPLATGAPLIGSVIDVNNAYLAIAQARSGELTLARQTAKAPQKRFLATKSYRLLRTLEHELKIMASVT